MIRTKTSGPSESLGELFFYVTKLAHFAKAEWLKVGLDICNFLASEKDFLVQCPEGDWSSSKDIMAEYADLVSMSRVLNRDVQLPVLEKEGWISTQSRLLVGPSTDRERLGRWRASSVEDYVRSSSTIVMNLQEAISKRLRGSYMEGDWTGETVDLIRLQEFLRERSVLVREGSDPQVALPQRPPTCRTQSYHRVRRSPKSS